MVEIPVSLTNSFSKVIWPTRQTRNTQLQSQQTHNCVRQQCLVWILFVVSTWSIKTKPATEGWLVVSGSPFLKDVVLYNSSLYLYPQTLLCLHTSNRHGWRYCFQVVCTYVECGISGAPRGNFLKIVHLGPLGLMDKLLRYLCLKVIVTVTSHLSHFCESHIFAPPWENFVTPGTMITWIHGWTD